MNHFAHPFPTAITRPDVSTGKRAQAVAIAIEYANVARTSFESILHLTIRPSSPSSHRLLGFIVRPWMSLSGF